MLSRVVGLLLFARVELPGRESGMHRDIFFPATPLFGQCDEKLHFKSAITLFMWCHTWIRCLAKRDIIKKVIVPSKSGKISSHCFACMLHTIIAFKSIFTLEARSACNGYDRKSNNYRM